VKKGFFITFEGGEGTGKSTQIERVKSVLVARGIEVVLTREPGGTEIAEQIRQILLTPNEEELTMTTELLLMFAARAQHLEHIIRPALRAGKWVLCDRFTDATYAYQHGGRNADLVWIQSLEQMVQDGLKPDLTLLFDAPVSVTMERAIKRGKLDRFEQEGIAFMERVRQTYLALAKQGQGRFRIIDASATVDQVTIAVMDALTPLLGTGEPL
jgi:dTMP kinase